MNTADTQTRTAQTWTLDPAHSHVEFGVRHMMISTVKGTFRKVAGTLFIDEDDPGASLVAVEIDAASIDTRNEDRDTHLRSEDFFAVESFPTLTFKSREVKQEGDEIRVVGDLTIKDQTREVVLEGEELGRGTDPWGNPRVGFRAETAINRKDFGLTWNQALESGGFLVGDKVTISLEIQAIPAAEESEED